MEFGIFTNMYHPKHWRDGKVRTEHETLRNELEYIKLADRMGFKYSWSAEHHFLDEYSHLSDSETFMAYALAQTSNIHVGSAIFNITPPVNHPARIAERVAMLDHLGEGRFEFGTGRGSSSQEVYGFGIDAMDTTRNMWDESLPQIVRMWAEDDYSYDGKYFSMPNRRVLPKPYTDPHPPIWVAAGSPSTFEKAGHLGLGVLCFTLGTPDTLAPLIETYKKAIESADPVGGYVNNNIMVTSDMMCLTDGDRARRMVAENRASYHTGLVFRYLDSFPRPDGFPVWPDLPPDPTVPELEAASKLGHTCVGDPDDLIRAIQNYVDIGADQLTFSSTVCDYDFETIVESYETFGREVLPKFDTDPVHSTTRQREAQCGASYGTR
ncbi:MAG: LLM class flavin-dependent oxidoreductase [Acidimicrobiales bacterium]|nr:LLM class flavin-dependent oxidoreductase [Acidimicrobiales bacterium]